MIRNLTIVLQVDDEDLDRDVPFDIWLFQFLNRLGYTNKVVSFNLDGSEKVIDKQSDLKEIHAEIQELSLTNEEIK